MQRTGYELFPGPANAASNATSSSRRRSLALHAQVFGGIPKRSRCSSLTGNGTNAKKEPRDSLVNENHEIIHFYLAHIRVQLPERPYGTEGAPGDTFKPTGVQEYTSSEEI